MKIEVYSADKKNEWDNFIEHSKNGLFMFKRDFMDYHKDRFADHSLMFYEETTLVAVLPANISENILYSHQGLTFGGVISNQSMKTSCMLDVFSAIKEYLKENGLNKIVYKSIPYTYNTLPSQEDLYALAYNGASLVRVDVTTTVEIANKPKVSSLRKRGAKKALKNGVTIQKSSNVKGYMDCLNKVLLSQHGTQAVHSVAEIELLISRFPENIKIFTAELEGKILAGVLIFEYKNIAHAQYIASFDEGKEIGALDLVFSTLIDDVYKDKKFFDFGISTESQGKVLNKGLISQKEGFGGRAVIHQFFELHNNLS